MQQKKMSSLGSCTSGNSFNIPCMLLKNLIYENLTQSSVHICAICFLWFGTFMVTVWWSHFRSSAMKVELVSISETACLCHQWFMWWVMHQHIFVLPNGCPTTYHWGNGLWSQVFSDVLSQYGPLGEVRWSIFIICSSYPGHSCMPLLWVLHFISFGGGGGGVIVHISEVVRVYQVSLALLSSAHGVSFYPLSWCSRSLSNDLPPLTYQAGIMHVPVNRWALSLLDPG
jgi:hypothetical protein